MRYCKLGLSGAAKCGLLAVGMVAASAFAQGIAEPGGTAVFGSLQPMLQLASANSAIVAANERIDLRAADLQRPLSSQEAETRYREGLDLARQRDMRGALYAFLEAAESGHGMAERKLGDIYGTGNDEVERDYETSLKWYQKTRNHGIDVPNKPFVYRGLRLF